MDEKERNFWDNPEAGKDIAGDTQRFAPVNPGEVVEQEANFAYSPYVRPQAEGNVVNPDSAIDLGGFSQVPAEEYWRANPSEGGSGYSQERDPVTFGQPVQSESSHSYYNTTSEFGSDEEPLPTDPNVVVRRVRSDGKGGSSRSKNKKPGIFYSLLDSLKFISIGLVIGILLVVFVVQRNDVSGNSMEPTLHPGDAVFVEMISRYFTGFSRNDVVTVDATDLNPAYYNKPDKIIKRVVGLPGEHITIKDGQVYINGELLDEPYLAEGVKTFVPPEGEEAGFDDITLGPDEYYCIGDNRGSSLDSRKLGPIPKDRIKARVFLRIFPLDQIKTFTISLY